LPCCNSIRARGLRSTPTHECKETGHQAMRRWLSALVLPHDKFSPRHLAIYNLGWACKLSHISPPRRREHTCSDVELATPQTERCPTRVHVPSHTHVNITIKVSVSRTRAVTHMIRQMIACRGHQGERLGVTPAHEQAAGTASCNTKSHARTLIRFAECRCKHRQQQQPTRDSHKKSVI
jgi:hypothetical protein